MKTKQRGVYISKGNLLVVAWDKKHPCPPEMEWVPCGECDARHPVGGHLQLLKNLKLRRMFLVFVPADLVLKVEQIAPAIWRIR